MTTTEQMIQWAEQEAKRADVCASLKKDLVISDMWKHNADIARAVAQYIRDREGE